MAMFAKRHYEAIATLMQELHPGEYQEAIDYDGRLDMWDDMRAALARLFDQDNDRFDRVRFGQACKPGANVRSRKVA